ncbi:hypothetical protein TNCV_2132951 [Trichonephila clavipes]|nr:hypothetical protein TNCV_2132951 [Trichonephila clavipes]
MVQISVPIFYVGCNNTSPKDSSILRAEIRASKRSMERIEELLDSWVEALQRLDDAGKSRATTEDISVRTSVDGRGPQCNGKTPLLSEQLSSTGFIVMNYPPSGRKLASNMTLRRNLRSGSLFRRLYIMPVCYQVRLQGWRARSMWTALTWGRLVFRDESRFKLCTADNCRQTLEHGDPTLTITHQTLP